MLIGFDMHCKHIYFDKCYSSSFLSTVCEYKKNTNYFSIILIWYETQWTICFDIMMYVCVCVFYLLLESIFYEIYRTFIGIKIVCGCILQ